MTTNNSVKTLKSRCQRICRGSVAPSAPRVPAIGVTSPAIKIVPAADRARDLLPVLDRFESGQPRCCGLRLTLRRVVAQALGGAIGVGSFAVATSSE